MRVCEDADANVRVRFHSFTLCIKLFFSLILFHSMKNE